MNISITWDNLHNDLNFKECSIFFDFSECRQKIHDNIEFSRENSKPSRDSRITIR